MEVIKEYAVLLPRNGIAKGYNCSKCGRAVDMAKERGFIFCPYCAAGFRKGAMNEKLR